MRSLDAEGPRGTESVHDRLDGERIRTLDLAGIRTRVYEAGEGPPLLLVHGGQFGSMYSLDCWSLVLGSLAQHFRVIAFDKLGQGHTDPPKRPEDYVIEAVQAHIERSDICALEAATVIGESAVAFVIAQAFLEKFGGDSLTETRRNFDGYLEQVRSF